MFGAGSDEVGVGIEGGEVIICDWDVVVVAVLLPSLHPNHPGVAQVVDAVGAVV